MLCYSYFKERSDILKIRLGPKGFLLKLVTTALAYPIYCCHLSTVKFTKSNNNIPYCSSDVTQDDTFDLNMYHTIRNSHLLHTI